MLNQIQGGVRPTVDWPVVRGDAWKCRFRIERNGTFPPNWDGYAFFGAVRAESRLSSDEVAVIAFDTNEGNGWLTMTAGDETQRAELPAGTYYFDVKWVPPGGATRTLFGGKFMVAETMTLAAGG